MLTVGVLALQGGFAKHADMLKKLNVDVRLVKKPSDLNACQALIIPGGESTVISRHIHFIKLKEPILQFAEKKPIYGTCAGLILIARSIEDKSVPSLGLLDIEIKRNAFGRQIDSFKENISVSLSKEMKKNFQAVFIRAPRIKECGPDVEILATYQDEPIFVRQGIHMGSTFHPELTDDPFIHQYFLSQI